MLPAEHLKKAMRLEDTITNRLDPERDWELFIEGAYGCALHYIAYITGDRHHEHRDTHEGLSRFLGAHGLETIREAFNTLDLLRQGRWYGKKGNGDAVKEAMTCVRRIKGTLDER
ncbi:MAG: hypothetical protein QGG50_05045 [Methanopyri archaeon]|jgi:hypothetical protein|nr:hypothetical protein [Methanopyri archaeon]